MPRVAVTCGLLLLGATCLVPELASQAGKQSRSTVALSYVALAPAQAADDKPKEATSEELAEKAYVAMEKNCSGCHGAGRRLNRMAATDRASHKRLIEEQKKVVPGKPGQSSLYTRMLDKARPMPPPNARQRPIAEEIEAIRLWIEKGAPAPRLESQPTQK